MVSTAVSKVFCSISELIIQTWNRIIRFVSDDGRVLLGEPKDSDLDIGLALAEDRRVDVYVLSGEHIWDLNVIRTGEEAVVKKVRTSVVMLAVR
jgi:hypothetical protein